jgi:lysophospholipase L1-like esterase
MKWEQGGKPLLELITRIKADGTPLLFVIFPYQFQVVEKEKQTDPVFSSFMKEHNVPLVDMLFPFSISDANLYLKNDMIHLNKAGHQLAAETIWNSLSKM